MQLELQLELQLENLKSYVDICVVMRLHLDLQLE